MTLSQAFFLIGPSEVHVPAEQHMLPLFLVTFIYVLFNII
jgi:hypothetical protein